MGLYYSDVDAFRLKYIWFKGTFTVISASIFRCGFSDGDVVILIPVLETYSILKEDYLACIPVPPNMASDEQGLTLCHHIRRDLKEQPITEDFQVHRITLI